MASADQPGTRLSNRENSISAPECTICSRCSIPDVTLRATDGGKFGTTMQNLSPRADSLLSFNNSLENGNQDIIELSESSQTVNLILRFMHSTGDQPALSNYPDRAIVEFAKAVENYRIIPAQAAVKLKLQEITPRLPIQVYAFAVQYPKHMSLFDEVEPHVLRVEYDKNTFGELFNNSPLAALALVKFRDSFWKTAHSALEKYKAVPEKQTYRTHSQDIPLAPDRNHCQEWNRRWKNWESELHSCEVDPAQIIWLPKAFERCFEGFECWYCEKSCWSAQGDVQTIYDNAGFTSLKSCVESICRSGL